MKKQLKIIFIGCLMLLAPNIVCQNKNKISNSVYFAMGANVGQIRSDRTTKNVNVTEVSKPLIMGHIGLMDMIKITPQWGIKTGAIMTIDGGVSSYGTDVIVFTSIPIQAQYYINHWLSAVGGFNLDIQFMDYSTYGQDYNENINPSFSIGFEAKLSNSFKLYTNYNLGLSNIVDMENGHNIYEDYDYSNGTTIRTTINSMSKSVFQLGFGILLE
jgi:hypothetical protein